MPITYVVTVTYGARWEYLHYALASGFREGIAHAIVIDNASQQDIGKLAGEAFPGRVTVVRSERNLGSAGGFALGLRTAVGCKPDFILLLDDDNVLEPDCLAELHREHAKHAESTDPSNLVIAAYRPDHYSDLDSGVPMQVIRRDAFFGFSVAEVPAKLWRRTLGKTNLARRVSPPVGLASAELEVAPYSGMFFSLSVPLRHGLPDERLVLYGDDIDFSSRVTSAGGRVLVTAKARLTDLERSWNSRDEVESSAIDRWLLAESDARIYYAARNRAYWERHNRGGHGQMREINRLVYLSLIKTRALQLRRLPRFELLLSAIRDGEAVKLGECGLYPL